MQPGKINPIECVAVVAVLGLVGALTVPRFTRADAGPSERAERRNQIRILRVAVERYRLDHQCYPARLGDGASPPGSAAAFVSQLTSATDGNGVVGPATSMRFCYGPYLRDGLPGGDATTDVSELVRVIRDHDNFASDGASTAVFIYNCDTGQITLNEPAGAEVR